jgi:hypothetical protein
VSKRLVGVKGFSPKNASNGENLVAECTTLLSATFASERPSNHKNIKLITALLPGQLSGVLSKGPPKAAI